MDLSPLLSRLISGGALTEEEAFTIGAAIAAHGVSGLASSPPPTSTASASAVDGCQLSALLALLARDGHGGAPVDALRGFARAFRAAAVPCAAPAPATEPLCDIVGTGGDGSASINISTAAALLAAAAGCRVAKHGSVGVSSRSGAADVLAALGVPHLRPRAAAACLAAAGITFLYAPHHHPGLAAAAPLRRALRARTVFNALGPLLNPARATRLVLGVAAAGAAPAYALAAEAAGAEHAIVVHCALPGGGGLDELAPAGPCEVLEVRSRSGGGGPHTRGSWTEDAAAWSAAPLRRCTAADLEGGGPADNAALLLHLFVGAAAWADAAAVAALPAVGAPPRRANIAAIADAVALNAGAVLFVAGRAQSIQEGTAAARAPLERGAAAEKLREWRAAALRAAADEEERERSEAAAAAAAPPR